MLYVEEPGLPADDACHSASHTAVKCAGTFREDLYARRAADVFHRGAGGVGQQVAIRQCAACAHRYTHPVPAPEDFSLFYDDDAAYQAFRTEQSSGRSALYVWLRELRLRHRARMMTKRMGRTGRRAAV